MSKYPSQRNFSSLYHGDHDPRIVQERVEIQQNVQSFVQTRKSSDIDFSDPLILKKALDEYEALCATGRWAHYYTWLRTLQENDNTDLKAINNQCEEFALQQTNELTFFELRLAMIPVDQHNLLLNNPLLAPYKHYLQIIFDQRRFMLTEKEEQMISMLRKSAYANRSDMVEEFLSTQQASIQDQNGTTSVKSFSELVALSAHPNATVRDQAHSHVSRILSDHALLATHEINSICEFKKQTDAIRGFERADHSRHLSDDIDTEVVDMIIDVVSNSYHLVHNYYKLKAQLMGKEILDYHERTVPYGIFDKSFTYDQAVDIIIDAFSDCSPKFGTMIKQLIMDGWVDAFPYTGKRWWAFCAYGTIRDPIYILLNFTGRVEDIETFAHECGHALNDLLMKNQCNALTYGTPMSTAEVASTFFEDFAFRRISDHLDNQEKFALLCSKFERDIATIQRQIACYQFEQRLHKTYRQNWYVSKQDISQAFVQHMQAYMWPYVQQWLGADVMRVRWSHLRSFFYVYSYASGLLIAKAMQRQYAQDPHAIKYIEQFLSVGRSKSPKDAFLDMGIDITQRDFWQMWIMQMYDDFDTLLSLAQDHQNLSFEKIIV